MCTDLFALLFCSCMKQTGLLSEMLEADQLVTGPGLKSWKSSDFDSWPFSASLEFVLFISTLSGYQCSQPTCDLGQVMAHSQKTFVLPNNKYYNYKFIIIKCTSSLDQRSKLLCLAALCTFNQAPFL